MNILYLDIDTLSPKHMSCYGYYRKTTPNIDKIAEESAIFTNMYTSDAPCLPSRTSLITGRYGINHGVVNHGGKYANLRNEEQERGFNSSLSKDGLFAVLNKAGFRTISISSFVERHSAFHFNAGFNEIINYGDTGDEIASEVYDLTEEWLDRNIDKDNWFLHVHMWDPHTPYRCPNDFANYFEFEEFKTWITDSVLEQHLSLVGPHTAFNLDMYSNLDHPNEEFIRAIGEIKNIEDLRTVIDGYDLGILYSDYYIGKIIQKLKDNNIYDNTLIVLSSDHGENMGQLGLYSEHSTADEFTCNIPFIVKVPGKNYNGKKFTALHLNIDILPTIAEYFNIKKEDPSTQWHGRSFLSSFTNEIDHGHDYLILSQMAHVCQRSVRFRNYIYIRTYHDGYHLWEKEMLFDLDCDPNEQYNIIKDNIKIRNEAISYLMQWHDEQMYLLPAKTTEDPLWYIIKEGGPYHANNQVVEYVKILQNRGRIKEAMMLIKNHPNWFKNK